MYLRYKFIRNTAIFLGFLTLVWVIYDTIKNYKSLNSDYLKANSNYLAKNYQESLELYIKAAESEPNNLYALEGQARSLLRLGKIEQAEKAFIYVLEKDKSFIPALTNIGILYDVKGDYKQAIIYYGKALEKEIKIANGLSFFKRFLKNIQFKPSNVEERLKYIQNQLKLPKDNRKLKNIKIDKIQPDFQM
jgi:tetratricopeptide (TPR) repeat protein